MKTAMLFLALGTLGASCSQSSEHATDPAAMESISAQTMNAEELTQWFASEGSFHGRSQQLGDKTYRVVHLPAQLLALREAGMDAGSDAVKTAEAHYRELEYFRLEIASTEAREELLKQDAGDIAEYNRRVSYCAFGMEKDITIVTGDGDSIPCALFHFERSFNVTPSAGFLVAFDREEVGKAATLTFILNDHLFYNGPLKFSFTREELLAVPQLNP